MNSLQNNTSASSKKIRSNVPLAEFTTFGIGGPAAYFCEVHTLEDLQEALRFVNERSLPLYVLGKGSNSLFDDHGYAGLVLYNRIDFLERLEENRLRVGSGFSFSRLGTLAAREGLSGLEFASGIPGSVGGAVFMNAGANGRETCQALESVEFLDRNGTLKRAALSELEMSYRHSRFHKEYAVIYSATFALQKDASARERQLEILAKRKSSQPLQEKSAGCVFRNPEGGYSGALIEQCGLKGKRIGGAVVSEKHSNFIVNGGGATAQDVLNLAKFIQESVLEKTGMRLQMEVRYVPYE
ncbi:MAG: UDP-N-acetylmuramate dehydrogenase [Chlamydiia bacterium]|nr:UDP-N-acetylmuramate dehydrogenase [Chlamydiia bacterium]